MADRKALQCPNLDVAGRARCGETFEAEKADGGAWAGTCPVHGAVVVAPGLAENCERDAAALAPAAAAAAAEPVEAETAEEPEPDEDKKNPKPRRKKRR